MNKLYFIALLAVCASCKSNCAHFIENSTEKLDSLYVKEMSMKSTVHADSIIVRDTLSVTFRNDTIILDRKVWRDRVIRDTIRDIDTCFIENSSKYVEEHINNVEKSSNWSIYVGFFVAGIIFFIFFILVIKFL